MRVDRVSRAEAQKLLKAQKKPHKYHAKRTVIDGIKFDSQKEAERWSELKLLERAGRIGELRRQVVYGLHAPVLSAHSATSTCSVGFIWWAIVSTYIADFSYVENGEITVEDCKGMPTPAYRQKRKHMLIEYGIQIKET